MLRVFLEKYIFEFESGEYGPEEYNHLGFLGIKFDSPSGTPQSDFRLQC